MLLVTGLIVVSVLIIAVIFSRLGSCVALSFKADAGLVVVLVGAAVLGFCAVLLGAADALRVVTLEEPDLVVAMLLVTLRAFCVSLLVVTMVGWRDGWWSEVQKEVDVRLCRSILCCCVSLGTTRIYLVRIVRRYAQKRHTTIKG